MGLKNVKDKIIEERNKAQEDAQKDYKSQNALPPGMSSMMSQAKSMSSSLKSGSFHIPSSLHL